MKEKIIIVIFLVNYLIACSPHSSNLAKLPINSTVSVENKSIESSTQNSGVDWENLPKFECFSSIKSDQAWVVNVKDNQMTKTNDGGNTWNRIVDFKARCVDFVSSDNGWAIDTLDRLLITSDGGKSWRDISSNITLSTPKAIKVLDKSNVWVMDAVALYNTVDGGASWTKSLSYRDKVLVGQPGSMFFLDSKNIWVCDSGDKSGRLYHSTNGGKSWSTLKLAETSPYPCKISFANSKDGYYSLGAQNYFFTVDGGMKWEKLKSIPRNFVAHSIFWNSDEQGWLAGYIQSESSISPKFGKASLLFTNDKGKTWSNININDTAPFFETILFTNEDVGWLLSRDNIYKSIDNGVTWKLTSSP